MRKWHIVSAVAHVGLMKKKQVRDKIAARYIQKCSGAVSQQAGVRQNSCRGRADGGLAVGVVPTARMAYKRRRKWAGAA